MSATSTPTRPRPPVRRGPDAAALVVRLARAERGFVARWSVLMALGFVVLWLGPFIFATLVWLTQARWGGGTSDWSTLFWWCALIGIPLAFAVERATRGTFLADAVESMPDPGTITGFVARRRGGVMLLLMEMALWGPRMCLAGFDRVRSAWVARGSASAGATLDAAGRALAVLLADDTGVPTVDVMTRAGLDADALGDALGYLAYHEWAGISKDGLRVWASSDARRRLGMTS